MRQKSYRPHRSDADPTVRLLEDTLIVWGGEFGRTPFREGRTASSKILGRDHYPDSFTIFLAGGGIKHGISYGETDELGFSVARDKVVMNLGELTGNIWVTNLSY